MIATAKYGNCESLLEPDDVILLFTDGIFEVFDAADHEFGAEKMAAALRQFRNQPLDALLDGLLTTARNFSANKTFDDDVCLIALEAVPG